MKTINKLVIAAAMLACARPAAAAVVEELAARVNNEPVTVSEYKRTKEALAEQYAAAMPDFFKQKDADAQLAKSALDKLVDEALLRQKADALKIKVYERELENGVGEIRKRFSRSPSGEALAPEKAEAAFREELKREGVTMEEFRERIRKQLMVQKLVQDTIRTRAKMPGENETRAYYENILLVLRGEEAKVTGLDEEARQDLLAVAGRFKELTAERLRLRHILIKTAENASPEAKKAAQGKAQAVRKDLDKALDFDEAVEKNSDDIESAKRAGDLGYIVKGMLPPEVEAVAFKMQVGDNSQPVESKFGWHILRLEEKRAAQKLRYEAVRDDLEQVLSQNSFATELGAYIKELRKDAKIQIFLDEKK
ncbi:MAG: peptidylprolyl isomerase [Elusimicrobiales bacterium]|nr:peptidylprolyl isomerase [Elusimicrobiales bacterium]